MCGSVGECLLAGVIFRLQGPGATGNWVHALLTSGVRTVDWHGFYQREPLADRAHWLVSLEKLPIKLTHSF